MSKLTTYQKNKRNITVLNKKLRHARNARGTIQHIEGGDIAFWDREIAHINAKIDAITYKCDGEAHSNPHIDNCGACAPLWGSCVRRYTDDELCTVLQHALSEPFTEESYAYGSDDDARVREALSLNLLRMERKESFGEFLHITDAGRELVAKWKRAQSRRTA